MAERQLRDVPDILEENVFDSGMSVVFSMNGRFRDIDSLILRNAISKAIIQAEASDPSDTDLVIGLTQYWINTTTKARFISVNGEDWVNVTTTATPGESEDGEDGEDGWTPRFAIVSDSARRVLQVADWIGGGGTKPATGQYVTATGFSTDISTAIDIRGPIGIPGTDGQSSDGDDAWTPIIAVETDEARRVLKVIDWVGGSGTKPAINQYLNASGFTATLAQAIDVRGAPGDPASDLSIETDNTLQGDGTSSSPLGVVASDPEGEIGKVLLLGNYVFGTSATPSAQNAGYTGGNLYLHTTATDGDKSNSLGNLNQGDYIHIGAVAILKISATPVNVSNVWTIAVDLVEGTVPTSNSHTVYFIKENRALIAGSVHSFNLSNGSVLISHLAAEVISNWLASVSSSAALIGDGTTGSPLDIASRGIQSGHLHIDAIRNNAPIVLGRWTRDSSNGNNSGSFQAFNSSNSVQLYVNEINADTTNRRTQLLALRSGNKISAAGVILTLTETPTASNDVINFVGTWPNNTPPDTTVSQMYQFINISSDILATNLRRAGYFLGLDDDLNLIWDLPQASQQDESSGSADIEVGMYENLGEWTWVSTSAPITGQFYVDSGEIRIFDTNVGGTSKGTELSLIGIGDRFQLDDQNAFEVTAAGVASGNTYWVFQGNWAEVFDTADFDGNYSIRHIKKSNVLVRNNAVQGRYLKLNDALLPEAADPDDSFETIWEGEFNNMSIETQNLNAGKKFSDYTHIVFNYSGINRRNLWTVPVALFDANGSTEIHNRDKHLSITHRNDTQFSLAAGGSVITLYKIHGYKGV